MKQTDKDIVAAAVGQGIAFVVIALFAAGCLAFGWHSIDLGLREGWTFVPAWGVIMSGLVSWSCIRFLLGKDGRDDGQKKWK